MGHIGDEVLLQGFVALQLCSHSIDAVYDFIILVEKLKGMERLYPGGEISTGYGLHSLHYPLYLPFLP